MNRRHFLAACALVGLSAPVVVSGLGKQNCCSGLETFHPTGEDIPIFSMTHLEGILRHSGVRCAHYSASCVDRNGKFPNEDGFDEFHNEPFIRKCYVLKSLPKVWSEDPEEVYNVIRCIKDARFGMRRLRANVLKEIEDNMKYVCLVWYSKVPCLCGREACPKHWIPIVGGLTKKRYQQYLDQMV